MVVGTATTSGWWPVAPESPASTKARAASGTASTRAPTAGPSSSSVRKSSGRDRRGIAPRLGARPPYPGAPPSPLRSPGRTVDQYPVTTCSVCGDASELDYGYTTVKSGTGRVTRCLTCWKRRRERRELATVMLPFAAIVTLSVLSGR